RGEKMEGSMHKLSESELKAAVLKFQKKEQPDIGRGRFSRGSEILRLRRTLKERLQSVFAESGLDSSKIGRILAEHQKEISGVFKKQKAHVEKEMSDRAKQHRSSITAQRKLFEQLKRGPLTTTPYVLDTAFYIKAMDFEIKTHTAPWD